MSFIVKAGPGCNGMSCRICEDYLPGFFSEDGGITVCDGIDDARAAEQSCPQQIISIQECCGE